MRVCITARVYRGTSEYSDQDLYKVLVYHGKQSTSLNDKQNLTELRLILVVAEQTWGSRWRATFSHSDSSKTLKGGGGGKTNTIDLNSEHRGLLTMRVCSNEK